MIVMAALSFQGPQGAVTFPMRGLGVHWWNELDKGGHFAALEQPELFVDEVRASFRGLR